jgi:hypothetical protein
MKPEYIGRKFGMLTLIRSLPGRKCVCVCDCGVECVKRHDHVIGGLTSSCGHAKGELVSAGKIKHGECRRGLRTVEHRIWHGMVRRWSTMDLLLVLGGDRHRIINLNA